MVKKEGTVGWTNSPVAARTTASGMLFRFARRIAPAGWRARRAEGVHDLSRGPDDVGGGVVGEILDGHRWAGGERVVRRDDEHAWLAREDGPDRLRIVERHAHRDQVELVVAEPVELAGIEASLGDLDFAVGMACLERL